MGNYCCYPSPKKNNEIYASLLNDSVNPSASQIFDNNIKEVNDRVYSVEERCGKVFKQFSDDLKYIHDLCQSLKQENKELKDKINELENSNP